jgi:DNA-binding transcriptional LysR family regulator
VEEEYYELQLTWALVAQGRGWTLAFRSHREHPPAGLVAVPIRGFRLPWGLDILWRRHESNPAVAQVLEVLREVRGALAERGRATLSVAAMNRRGKARPGRRRSGRR